MVKSVIFYNSGQDRTKTPESMTACLCDFQSSQHKSLTPSEKRDILYKLLKLSQNEALNCRDMKKSF